MKYFMLWVGIALGNFVFQAFREVPNWGAAVERSYFQAAALLLAAWLI